ncbi:MAG: (Fe-S)-binding protein [Bacteroidota bacterium]
MNLPPPSVFDPFVIPFSAGVIFLFVVLVVKYFRWISNIEEDEKKKIWKGIFSVKLFISLKEIFLECLIHRKIFKVNPVLGFMHMNFAFGWVLLIIVGTIESKTYSHKAFNAPWKPIFFRFFNYDVSHFLPFNLFAFITDFLLLIILFSVLLAVIKRTRSQIFGIKKTTKLKSGDKFALIALWLIFPMRFLAESFTSSIYHNGGFLTGTAGELFAYFLPTKLLTYPLWWGYSIVLCVFFVALPYSRYMHIPTEAVLILLRNFGIKPKQKYNGFTAIEVHSCSRCGICIDKCPLSSSTITNTIQPTYFLQSIREKTQDENKTFNCLLCGRCMEYCPVGIDINNQRIVQRNIYQSNKKYSYQYLNIPETKKADVIYFAGCMTHLTPAIKKAMTSIFNEANINYIFLDADGSICCGRPQMMAGNIDAAEELIKKNKLLIQNTQAKLLVASCPICYKIFNEEYKLSIPVKHHSEYLLQLVEENKIKYFHTGKTIVFHDPCELGRGSNIYNQPRQLLNTLAEIKKVSCEKNYSLCCGGSIGNTELSYYERDEITKDALSILLASEPDILVTACPLCKKTFRKFSNTDVMDIAELFAKDGVKKIIPILTQTI